MLKKAKQEYKSGFKDGVKVADHTDKENKQTSEQVIITEHITMVCYFDEFF